MVVHFLIDGYNVAHQMGIRVTKNTLEDVRRELERRLVRFKSQKKCQITIVYDGKGLLSSLDKVQEIDIIYTAKGESADFRIKKIIDDTLTTKKYCVVTSDHEIINYAKLSRVNVITSGNFLSEFLSPEPKHKESRKPSSSKHLSLQLVHQKTKDEKSTALSENELNEWKKIFK